MVTLECLKVRIQEGVTASEVPAVVGVHALARVVQTTFSAGTGPNDASRRMTALPRLLLKGRPGLAVICYRFVKSATTDRLVRAIQH